MKKLKIIYIATIVVLFSIIVVLSINIKGSNKSCLEIDNERCELEIKRVVSSALAKEITDFSDVCYGMYSGIIGSIRATQPSFGKEVKIPYEEKAQLCIEYALRTDHNMFDCAKSYVMSEISTACNCFVKKSEMSKMLDYAENAVSDILSEENTKNASVSAVKKILVRRIEAFESEVKAFVPKEEEKDSWEETTADIASFVSKVAVKMLFG